MHAADIPRRNRTIEVALPREFDWNAQLSFRAPRCIPGVEEVYDGVYRRTALAGGIPALLEFSASDSKLVVEITSAEAIGVALEPIIRKMFDLGAPVSEIDAHLTEDPLLAPLVAHRAGLRLPVAWDPFELAIRAIVGQQITVRAASTLAGRIVEQFGDSVAGFHPTLTRIFPSAQKLAAADMSRIGMPAKRIETLKRVSSAVASKAVPFDGKQALDEFVSALCELPGVGPWTANYVALRGFGYADAFPSSDLGLIRAFASRTSAGNESTSKLQRMLDKHAARWRPYRGYAALHLWSAA
jgi:DNA-3-methyladenine glycosylase II